MRLSALTKRNDTVTPVVFSKSLRAQQHFPTTFFIYFLQFDASFGKRRLIRQCPAVDIIAQWFSNEVRRGVRDPPGHGSDNIERKQMFI